MGNFVAKEKGLGEVSGAARPFGCMRPQDSHASVRLHLAGDFEPNLPICGL